MVCEKSESMNPLPVQRMENTGLNSQMLFQDVSLQFNCGSVQEGIQRGVEDPAARITKPRELTGFVVEAKDCSVEREQQFFRPQNTDFRRNIYENSPVRHQDDRQGNCNWNGHDGSTGTLTGDGTEGDDDDDDEDEDDEDDDDGDGEVEGLVIVQEGNSNKNNNNSSSSINSSLEKNFNEKGDLQKQHSSFGRGVMVKDCNVVHNAKINGSSSEQQHQQGRITSNENSVTIAEPDSFYSQLLQGSEGVGVVHKVIGGENSSGFSSRKDVSFAKESGESLRVIFSDPITGSLMDDAMILQCGHSFGTGGIQHVLRIKACYTCSQPVSEDSVAPNLSLRSAIQAFRREEELQSQRSKRRRERYEQNDCSNFDPFSMDGNTRGKGVQFPFVVNDRVIIKGNKRTPIRFVGREAVVTTQCLNGWYVVKTLDNAESVKLQYRSLAKISDNLSSTIASSRANPTWFPDEAQKNGQQNPPCQV